MAFNQDVLKILKKCKETTDISLRIIVSDKTLHTPSEFLGTDSFDQILKKTTSYEKPEKMNGNIYFPLRENGEIAGFLEAKDDPQSSVAAKLLLIPIRECFDQTQDGNNHGDFLKKILSGKVVSSDIRKYIETKGIKFSFPRILFLVETDRENDDARHILNQFFSEEEDVYVTGLTKNTIAISLPKQKEDDEDSIHDMAATIHEVLLSETMTESFVAYGKIAEDFSQMKESQRTAKIAMEIGKIFNPERLIHSYDSLGIGRIIYQLPMNFCEDFLKEVFPESQRERLDQELLLTIDQMIKSNLVISDAARELYIHRNTLIYRIDKIQKITKLDLRKFEDAEVLSLAITIGKYMKYMSDDSNN